MRLELRGKFHSLEIYLTLKWKFLQCFFAGSWFCSSSEEFTLNLVSWNWPLVEFSTELLLHDIDPGMNQTCPQDIVLIWSSPVRWGAWYFAGPGFDLRSPFSCSRSYGWAQPPWGASPTGIPDVSGSSARLHLLMLIEIKHERQPMLVQGLRDRFEIFLQ